MHLFPFWVSGNPSTIKLRHLLRLLCFLSLAAWSLPRLTAQEPRQDPDLAPKKTDGGVLFQCRVPNATVVYLAGDFNAWGNNNFGKITNDAASKMDGPDANGVWTKTVKLSPGVHEFKFVINGTPDGWFVPAWATDRGTDGNARVYVTYYGEPLLRTQSDQAWKPQQDNGMVTFSFFSPQAKAVYLAGDFNNWANNQSGKVTDSTFLMKKSDDGLWTAQVHLSQGRHLYQFVVDGDAWEVDPNESGQDDATHSVIDVK